LIEYVERLVTVVPVGSDPVVYNDVVIDGGVAPADDED